MNELIETQRHVITKNDKKMQNLIKKLDELNLTNNTKSSEISKLKYENSSLRNEVCYIKN